MFKFWKNNNNLKMCKIVKNAVNHVVYYENEIKTFSDTITNTIHKGYHLKTITTKINIMNLHFSENILYSNKIKSGKYISQFHKNEIFIEAKYFHKLDFKDIDFNKYQINENFNTIIKNNNNKSKIYDCFSCHLMEELDELNE